jgi:hypothetical protein
MVFSNANSKAITLPPLSVTFKSVNPVLSPLVIPLSCPHPVLALPALPVLSLTALNSPIPLRTPVSLVEAVAVLTLTLLPRLRHHPHPQRLLLHLPNALLPLPLPTPRLVVVVVPVQVVVVAVASLFRTARMLRSLTLNSLLSLHPLLALVCSLFLLSTVADPLIQRAKTLALMADSLNALVESLPSLNVPPPQPVPHFPSSTLRGRRSLAPPQPMPLLGSLLPVRLVVSLVPVERLFLSHGGRAHWRGLLCGVNP